MTAEPQSYRIVNPWKPGTQPWESEIENMEVDGVLVPDYRLQAIADAWNIGDRYQTATRVSLRVAWPELAVLLDAITKEDNDD